MGDNAIIVQIIAVLLILFFCFVTYMNTKTWRATHVVFMFLVFSAALTFAVYASLILKTRKAWQQTVEKLEKQATDEEKRLTTLINGDPKDAANALGIVHYAGAKHRAIIDRGRVWRDCKPTGTTVEDADPETKDAVVKVKLQLTDAEEVNPAELEITANTVVYAFVHENPEAPIANMRYVYVGEFYVSELTPKTITLTSSTPMDERDQGLAGLKSPWVLYERMPTDAHEVFASAADPLTPAVKPSDVITQDRFASPEMYNETLWEYERDGMTLEQVNEDRKAKGQSPLSPEEAQERMFAKVQFLKDFTVKVDAPMASSPRETSDSAFDSSGQALDPRLRITDKETNPEGEVKFKSGEEGEMLLHGHRDQDGTIVEKGAMELESDGVLKIVQTVYRRPLHDYAYEYKHLQAKRDEIQRSMRLVNFEIEVVKAEVKAAKDNHKARQAEQAKLKEDQTKLLAEKEKITQYATELENAYRIVRAELSRVYRENAALHDRIVAANEELTREIEARSGTPTSTER